LQILLKLKLLRKLDEVDDILKEEIITEKSINNKELIEKKID
jgi:hypothetical protein